MEHLHVEFIFLWDCAMRGIVIFLSDLLIAALPQSHHPNPSSLLIPHHDLSGVRNGYVSVTRLREVKEVLTFDVRLGYFPPVE